LLLRQVCNNESDHSRCQEGCSNYSYSGSLTTPGCTEGVAWSVLADGGGVSKAAVARLHQVIARFPYYYGYPNNNRPVLPLNGRVIKLRRGGKND
jgi:carbonic anhydrase